MNPYSVRRFLATAALLACGASLQVRADEIRLSSLDLSLVETGGHFKPQIDKSRGGTELRLGGKAYAHGIGMEARTQMMIALGGQASRFRAVVGVDDGVKPGTEALVEFRVMGDHRRILWSSGRMIPGDAPKQVDVDLTGVKVMTLLAADHGEWRQTNWADWAEARIEYSGKAPVAINAGTDPDARDADPQVVITLDNSSIAPRITAPAVVALEPGKPFLWTASSLGRAPLTWAVRGLPAGLSLDPATGCIQGMVTKPGIHELEVTVSNVAGVDSARVRLLVGTELALTPPLGWNSYDNFGAKVTEAEFLGNVEAFARDLKPFGWQYVVVDFLWFNPNPYPAPGQETPPVMDAFGRMIPAPGRFPSSVHGVGFKAIADKVHAQGLRFGIHIMRGIPRDAVKANLPIEGSPFHAADAADTSSVCEWETHMYGVRGDTPAGQAYYDSLLRLYASWGVDYIKVDDISSPYHKAEIAAVRRAIDKCGRSIVLSLSPGAAPVAEAEHLRANAQLWRTTSDFWDNWDQLQDQFTRAKQWIPVVTPGHWPDADMLPVGHIGDKCVGLPRRTGFSPAEQVTLVSFWSLLPSPLMIGSDLRVNTTWDLALLTNPEILAVNQDALGAAARCVVKSGTIEVWTKVLANGSLAVGFFNLGDSDAPLSAEWAQLGLEGPRKVRDLWRRADLGVFDREVGASVKAHGAAVYLISAPRVLAD